MPSYYSQFGGFIMSAAINKYIFICVNRSPVDRFIRVKYSISERVSSVDEVEHDLVKPALKLLKLDHSLEIVSLADAPAGTGLGSSGSYLVALLAALYELKREKVPTRALAETAFDIEMNQAHHPIGKQDPYLAAFGGVTCLDIAKDGRVDVLSLGGFEQHASEFRNRVLLFYTGQLRSSITILKSQKELTETRDPVMMESLHRTKELGYHIREVLQQGDLDQFGLLLDEHWRNKKRRAGPISDSRIDGYYEVAKRHGALGGKIIGAGGGGFLMFCCKSGQKNELCRALAAEGLSPMSYDFDYEGAKVLVNL